MADSKYDVQRDQWGRRVFLFVASEAMAGEFKGFSKLAERHKDGSPMFDVNGQWLPPKAKVVGSGPPEAVSYTHLTQPTIIRV